MPKRRHLSRSHRAAISRGLRRYWRRRKRRAARDRRQAKARRQLKAQQRTVEGKKRFATEEWELTVRYTRKGRAIGITMRVVAPRGSLRDTILLVAQRAGMSVERGFQVQMTDWQQALHGRERHYGPYDPQEVMGWMGMLRTAIARGTVRAEKVGE